MPSIIKRITAILLTLTIVGCAGTPVDPTDTRRSVVFGYIDMEDAPTSVDWVFIQHYDGRPTGTPLVPKTVCIITLVSRLGHTR